VASRSPDISERTIIDLSGRLAQYYDLNGNAFDVAIGGLPFIMAVTDNTPYKRQTAEFRAQRVDQMREPGEHTLGGSGYWTRSQSSWHYGEGILFAEPMEGNENEVRFRFRDSFGVNVWTPGEVSLLPKTDKVLTMRGKTTLASGSNSSPTLYAIDTEPIVTTTTTTSAASGSTTLTVASTAGISVGWRVADGSNITSTTTVTAIGTGTITISPATTAGTMASGTTLRISPVTAIYSITTAGTSTAYITYNQLGNQTILAQTSDGANLYVATTTALYDIDLTAGTVHQHYTINNGTPISAVIKFVKSRAIFALTYDDYSTKAYELTFTGAGHQGGAINISTLTAISGSTLMPYRWVWSGITEGSAAIYLSGYAGEHSSIFKLQVDNTGALGTIVTAAVMPRGEFINSLYSYLGTYILIGTNKGARIGTLDQNGEMTYGPLVFHNENGVYDFEGRDSYIWAGNTNQVNSNSGTTRINLGQPLTLIGYAQPISTGVYARATDVFADGITGTVRSVRIIGNTNLVAFAIDNNGVWLQNATELVPTGEIRGGRIRYDTMENKAWKRIRIRTTDNLAGGDIEVFKINPTSDTVITTLYEGTSTEADIDLGNAYPDISPDASFKLTLSRNSTDATTGPVVVGIAVKALPTPTRARILQIPLFCYDKETDKTGNMIGYEGYSKDRLNALETLEGIGDTVVLQDFNSGGEPFEVIIDQVTFTRSTPSNRNYTGFGGIIQLIARTVV
jgi:hypothetical protein